jgi:hypothetical protein
MWSGKEKRRRGRQGREEAASQLPESTTFGGPSFTITVWPLILQPVILEMRCDARLATREAGKGSLRVAMRRRRAERPGF